MATQATFRPVSIFRVEEVIRGNSRWLIAAGIAMIIIGIAALWMSVATTLVSVVFLGGLCLLSAIFQAVFAMTSGRWSGFGLHLLLAMLYGIAGVFLLGNPGMGAATLTVFLAFLFVTSGLFRVVASAMLQFSGWGWALISGIVTTALGFYVLGNLPIAALYLLGTLIGIDLLFIGAHLTAFGVALKRGVTKRANRFTPAYT